MKPWLVWLLDPRPPWWRSTRVWLLPFLFFGVLALIEVPSPRVERWIITAHVDENGQLRLEESPDDSAALGGRSFRYEVVLVHWKTPTREWAEVRYSTCSLSTEFQQAFPPLSFMLSDVVAVHQAWNDAVSSHHQELLLTYQHRSMNPDVQRRTSALLAGTAGGMTPHTLSWEHWIRQRVLISAFWLIFVVALARRWFEGMLLRRLKRLDANICPSCEYPTPGEECPECGIDVDQERVLIQALNERGYRGLKALGA
ncbi:MAG: hypothetical protein AAFS11_02060 [Planctomycetota bacterium]